jgi:hypothetical protein
MVIASRTIPFPLRRLLGHNPSTQVRFQLFVRVVETSRLERHALHPNFAGQASGRER